MKKYLLVSLAFLLTNQINSEEVTSIEKSTAKINSGEISPKSIENSIVSVNQILSKWRQELTSKYKTVNELQRVGAKEEEFAPLFEQIKELKKKILNKEKEWREFASSEAKKGGEGYAFWDQGETTLSQLIMEYGSSDFLYIIPPEIGSTRLQMFSSLCIPQDSWDEMIELILAQNGIGVKKLNPFLKELYLFKTTPFSIEAIASSPQQLTSLPDKCWVFYILSTPPEQLKAMQGFFERFADNKQTNIQIVGSKLIIAGQKENIEKLLELQNAIWGKDEGKVLRVYKLTKLNVADAEKIIKGFFQDSSSRVRTAFALASPADDLTIVSLPYGALVFMGEERVVKRAERLLEGLENDLDDPEENVLFWYTCKHSDPQDVAAVLEKLYGSMHASNITPSISPSFSLPPTPISNIDKSPLTPIPSVVLPKHPKEGDKGSGNFIIDPKTGSIVMIVKKDELPKIKALLKKLDVPKKMVQIDVLLVEKKVQDRKQTGINLLNIGGSSSHKRHSHVHFDDSNKAEKKGILEFLLSCKKGDLPAFDLALNFLMSQQDIQINANPSVLAVNNTPATISVLEEISIDNGSVKYDDNKRVDQSFSRSHFGITINMTPIIHLGDEEDGEDGKGFVTLQTNVTFDTVETSDNDRPPVTKRHIENEVRIADGETIILGGLRKKTGEDVREKIPFLGELPGIGKLFGTTKIADNTTEMFIFITPRIIKNPIDDLKKIRRASLNQRAGDTPEFLQALEAAKKNEHRKLFENSLKLLFENT